MFYGLKVIVFVSTSKVANTADPLQVMKEGEPDIPGGT
jgi:hypothetical protein|tara:strand:+ start:637 stop:750 length:114 start_codon:yes stop_codon:yes gene_type:complete